MAAIGSRLSWQAGWLPFWGDTETRWKAAGSGVTETGWQAALWGTCWASQEAIHSGTQDIPWETVRVGQDVMLAQLDNGIVPLVVLLSAYGEKYSSQTKSFSNRDRVDLVQ